VPSISNKVFSFSAKSFWTSLGAICVALITGFWAFYTYGVSAIRDNYAQQLTRESQRMNEMISQAKTNNQTLLDSLRRETEAKAETAQAEQKTKLRELELLNQASVAQLDARARQEKEALNQVVDGLRQKLAVSRSSLEISASGGFVSVKDLRVDEQTGRARLAEGGYVNLRQLLLPDYTAVGWEKIENASLAQLEGYFKEKTIKLPPDEEAAKNAEWQPLLTLWVKESKNAVAVVGAAQLSKKEFYEFLQRANASTTTTAIDKEGTKSKTTETATIDAKKLSEAPIGLTAYGILGLSFFSGAFVDPQTLTVRSFSARTDALHFAGTVNDKGESYDVEMLVLEDSSGVFLLLNAFSSANALDPISSEATDWLRKARIVTK
jgi:hypothetical protein